MLKRESIPIVAISPLLNSIDACGKSLLSGVFYIIHLLLMIYVSVRAVTRGGGYYFASVLRLTLDQIYDIGFRAVLLITTLGLAIGGVVILNFSSLPIIGGTDLITRVSLIVIVRELGPMLVALILIARSGTAMAAEIANMKVNRELEALKVMAINPLAYVVFPRLVAGTFCTLILTFYFNTIALFGGFLVTRMFREIHFSSYFFSLTELIGVSDVVLFYVKNGMNGLAIFSICCYQGLQVKNSPHEVPIATTKAVLNSIMSVVICSIITTTAFYLNQIMDLVGL